MKVLLVSTNQVDKPYPVYPLGVAHLVGALRDAGHRVEHYDVMASGGVAGLAVYADDLQPDLVGVSIRNLDTVDSTAPDAFIDGAVEAVKEIRKHFRAPVVLGGPAFSR